MTQVLVSAMHIASPGTDCFHEAVGSGLQQRRQVGLRGGRSALRRHQQELSLEMEGLDDQLGLLDQDVALDAVGVHGELRQRPFEDLVERRHELGAGVSSAAPDAVLEWRRRGGGGGCGGDGGLEVVGLETRQVKAFEAIGDIF